MLLYHGRCSTGAEISSSLNSVLQVSLLAEKLDDGNLEAVGAPQLDIKCVFGGQTVESQVGKPE